jgi:integrase
MPHLTDNFAERATRQDGQAQIEFRDDKLTGFLLRVGSKLKVWQFLYYIDGKKRRFELGEYPAMSADAARIAALDINKSTTAGKDPIAEQRRKEEQAKLDLVRNVSFEVLARQYLATRTNLRSYIPIKRLVEYLIAELGTLKAKDITRRELHEVLKKHRAHPRMLIQYRVYLGEIFKYALAEYIIESNPAADLAVMEKVMVKDRARFLTEDEVAEVWKAIEQYPDGRYQAIAKLALYTGCRQMEIASIRREHVEVVEGGAWLTIPAEDIKTAQKTGQDAFRTWLAPSALALLQAMSESGPLYFEGGKVGTSGQPITTFYKFMVFLTAHAPATESAGHFRFHDFRRTVATLMNKHGTEGTTVERVLNHAVRGIAGVYNRYSFDAEKRRALTHWANCLDMIVSGQVDELAAARERKMVAA